MYATFATDLAAVIAEVSGFFALEVIQLGIGVAIVAAGAGRLFAWARVGR